MRTRRLIDAASPIVPGRSCGTCTLCCKVLKIEELAKPQHTWCPKCNIGKGCSIYSSKPSECSNFYCGYLTVPELDSAWWPGRSKIVLTMELAGTRLAAYVDKGRPGAWRDEPYYSQLKKWAMLGAETMRQVTVHIGRQSIVVLPHKDVDLGEVADDERIITAEISTPLGPQLEAFKLHRDDPRIAGMKPGEIVQRKGI